MVDAVTEDEIDAKMAEYAQVYEMATDNIQAVRYQAREEVALEKFMEAEGFGAFHTNFQDLQQLRQLPGLAAQNLMRKGYGFAGEGDWKTAALCRIMKLMTQDCDKGTGFMEDYTYNFDPENGMNMGAHMLEVCPSLAAETPKIKVVPLGIGDREDPARVTFKAQHGPAVLATIVDMGDRFRMIVNDVVGQVQEHDMPNLPVAGVLWKPCPAWKPLLKHGSMPAVLITPSSALLLMRKCSVILLRLWISNTSISARRPTSTSCAKS